MLSAKAFFVKFFVYEAQSGLSDGILAVAGLREHSAFSLQSMHSHGNAHLLPGACIRNFLTATSSSLRPRRGASPACKSQHASAALKPPALVRSWHAGHGHWPYQHAASLETHPGTLEGTGRPKQVPRAAWVPDHNKWICGFEYCMYVWERLHFHGRRISGHARRRRKFTDSYPLKTNTFFIG
jgi:hypothetical protein